MEKNYEVHQGHCCVLHGCKYGDEDCPVVNGKVNQLYLCEGCMEETVYGNGVSFLKGYDNIIIKNCPFCGSSNLQVLNPAGSKHYFVHCVDCMTEGPIHHPSKCKTTSFKDAIKLWNRC